MNHFLGNPSPEELAKPLSPQELDELEDLLLSDATPDECMTLPEVDGFLTALAIGPHFPNPDQWLRVIWGRDDGLAFSPDEAKICGRLIGRMLNEIGRALEEDPPRFEPLIELVGKRGEVVSVAEEWCSGFLAGVAANADHWKPLIDDADNGLALLPIITLGSPEGLEALDRAEDPDAEYEKIMDLLHAAVPFLHEYWRSHSPKGGTAIPQIRPRALRIGRNNPCPCGSGRKFKRCCGHAKS